MPRFNVEHNGRWACFSSIVDGFITEFMNKTDYELWRKEEYGYQNYSPVEQCNRMMIKEAASSIRLNRNHERAIECLFESGLSRVECKNIIDDIESEYYCPIPKENGKFECPNCNKEVKQNQKECDDDTCCLEFVWRK